MGVAAVHRAKREYGGMACSPCTKMPSIRRRGWKRLELGLGGRWVSGGSVIFLPQRKWGMTEKLEIGEVTSGLRGEKRGINLWQLPLQVRAVS